MMNPGNAVRYINEPLLTWYDEKRRILPWREDPTGYHVWISEIMLQQTRVEAVKPYYSRFMDELPDVYALAECDDDRLMKLWEGLGYYSRARNLKKAALQIVSDHNGIIPGEYDELLKLPGIGSYTAGAISSIAFGQRRPAVDGNVLRVISRVTGSFADISLPETKRNIENLLLDQMDKNRPGDYNQALMELGAVVCAPNKLPECDICPLKDLCAANKDGTADRIPVKAPKKKRKTEELSVLILHDGIHILLHRRPEKGLLSGLYEPVIVPGHPDREVLLKAVRETGAEPLRILPLPEARHIFTHIEWRMKGYMVLTSGMDNIETKDTSFICVKPEEINDRYSVPSAYSAYAPFMNIHSGHDRILEYYQNYMNTTGGNK